MKKSSNTKQRQPEPIEFEFAPADDDARDAGIDEQYLFHLPLDADQWVPRHVAL